MKNYVKPIVEFDAVLSAENIANDPMLYADQVYGDELSVPAGDWDGLWE